MKLKQQYFNNEIQFGNPLKTKSIGHCIVLQLLYNYCKVMQGVNWFDVKNDRKIYQIRFVCPFQFHLG